MAMEESAVFRVVGFAMQYSSDSAEHIILLVLSQ